MKLEEIEAMVQAATNGHNWAMAFEPDKHIVIGEDIPGGSCVVVIPNEGGYRQERQRDKARLIAAAPTIIRELVERVEKMQAVVAAARGLKLKVLQKRKPQDYVHTFANCDKTNAVVMALLALDAKEQDDEDNRR